MTRLCMALLAWFAAFLPLNVGAEPNQLLHPLTLLRLKWREQVVDVLSLVRPTDAKPEARQL